MTTISRGRVGLALVPLAFFLCQAAWALGELSPSSGSVGVVTHANGLLLAKKANGGVRILAEQSAVEVGDTLVTDEDAELQIRLNDNSQLALQAASQIKIESYAFDAAHPESGRATLKLIRGGVIIAGGLLGKADHLVLETPVAAIDVREAVFGARYSADIQQAAYGHAGIRLAALSAETFGVGISSRLNKAYGNDVARDFLSAQWSMSAQRMRSKTLWAAALPNTAPVPGASLTPGLYVQVIDGAINLTNRGGSQNFSAGQFGYTASLVKPPVIVPANPGIRFTLPPSFVSQTAPANGGGSGKAAAVDCEVR